MRLAPYTLTLSFLLLACGGEPGTSATDSGTSESGASTSSSSASTGEPNTTGTSDPNPTTSGASESATGSTTEATTEATTAATTSGSTGPLDTSTSDSTGPQDTSTGADESSTGAESSTTSDDTTGAIMDCPTLKEAFNAETLKIRSCDQPADCGVELPMTSCGCTRNWVARKDADTTDFYDLLAQGQKLECELIGPSTCDCPAAEGFTCKQNICTWNYL